jgi:hypothetical protein
VYANSNLFVAAASGVLIGSNSVAAVKLPPSPAGDGGVYRLSFSPTALPGAPYAFTSKAVVIYADLG